MICFVTVMFTLKLHAQTKSGIIAAIKKEFQAINADRTLSKKVLSGEEFMENMTDGGGELTGFYKKDSLVKIIEWIGLSYGNRTREFYLKDNSLFFVYEEFQSFVINDSTGEMDHSKVKTTFEGRYYFNNTKLIEQKITGKRTFGDAATGIAKELLESAIENAGLLKQKTSDQ